MIALTGYNGVLSICCNACRLVRFLPVRTVNAADAAMKFYTGWIAIFGCPAIVRSDNGSAFIHIENDGGVSQNDGSKKLGFLMSKATQHTMLLSKRVTVILNKF